MGHKDNTKNITTSIKDDNKKSHLVIIMPAYNEAEHIKANLLKSADIISSFEKDYTIIVVNDGSLDSTYQEIKAAHDENPHIEYVSYSQNHGKGRAIKEGVAHANGDYIAFLDSDLELPPIMLKDYLKALKNSDAQIAIGSKLHKDSEIHYPLIRKFLSFGYYIMLKIMFRLNIKDTQTGIKLFKQDVIKPICDNLITTGFAFDIEILATASKKGHKIIEMPITLEFCRDRAEKSRITLKTIIQVFKDTLKIRKHIKHI